MSSIDPEKPAFDNDAAGARERHAAPLENNASSSTRLKPKMFRWYKLYFVLAVFDVLTVTFSLVLHHQLSSIYAVTVEDNQRWANRHELFERLQFQIVSINAPGNDVFESRDVAHERARQQAVTAEFHRTVAMAKETLGEGLAVSEVTEILASIDRLERLTGEMIAESELLYERFKEGNVSLAAKHMANMDQTYAMLIETISRIEKISFEIHAAALVKQSKLAKQTHYVEYMITALILLMVAGIALYGHRLSRQMARHERERTEQLSALEASEHRFRELTEGSIQGIVVHRDGMPIFVNDAWAWIHGFKHADSVDTTDNIADLIIPEDRDSVRDIQYALQYGAGHSRQYEYRAKHRDGKTIWLECLERVVVWQGKPALQSTIIDVTERKQAEEGLRDAMIQTEQATSARTRFFAAASHDLRQPLQAISLYLPLLKKQVQSEKGRKMLAAVENSADAMHTLMNSILDISRLVAGVIEPEIVPVSLLELFDQLGMEFVPQSKNKSLELRVLPADYWVMSDPALLERILRNLLSNAVSYTVRGKILLGVRRSGDELRIEVWDTGIGISSDSLERIFDEFYQADNPDRDRDRDRGLGLGLAIVDKLAKLMGHRLDVRSWRDRGSVFSLRLAQCAEPARSAKILPQGPAAETIDLAGRTVVIIDDNLDVLEGSREVLQSWGFNVIDAESIALALEKLNCLETAPDVILADLSLRKNETGLHAVRKIREVTGLPVPAIILTGDTDPERIREAMASDCALMHKPIKPKDLKAALSDIIREAGPQPTKIIQVKRAMR